MCSKNVGFFQMFSVNRPSDKNIKYLFITISKLLVPTRTLWLLTPTVPNYLVFIWIGIEVMLVRYWAFSAIVSILQLFVAYLALWFAPPSKQSPIHTKIKAWWPLMRLITARVTVLWRSKNVEFGEHYSLQMLFFGKGFSANRLNT